MKIHINPETGKTGKCTATVKSCKYAKDGVVPKHYDTEQEAREAYEKSMAEQALTTHSNAPSAVNPPLSSMMDIELLNRMVKDRYVNVGSHPKDPNLKILTYSTIAQIHGKWNDATIAARGLMIHSEKDDFSDAVIIERPWKKFFTLEQHGSGWSLGDDEEGSEDSAQDIMDSIDFDAPAEVSDKMDGSLGILYRAPDGKLAMSTKGSFASEQAKHYTYMLRNNKKMYEAAEKLKKDNPNTTFLYEMIGADNQIVLEYDDDDVVLLGAVDKDTNKYHSTTEYTNTWNSENGLHTAEMMQARTLGEALQIPDRPNREGVVVRTLSDDPEKQLQIKIKQEDYKRLHKLTTGISTSAIRETLRESKPDIATLRKVAQTGNVRHIKEVDGVLEPLSQNKSKFMGRMYEKVEDKFKDGIVEHAESLDRAYNYVSGLSNDNFVGDNREIKKKFFTGLPKDLSKVERGYVLAFFDTRLKGKSLDDLNTEPIMKNIAGKIKDGGKFTRNDE